MKLTNGEIFNAKAPLESLIKEKLPLKCSYGLAQLASKLNGQLQVIDKVRQGLFLTYGDPNPQNLTQMRCIPVTEERDNEGNVVKDAEDNPVMVPNPKYAKFKSEIEELMSLEVEVVVVPVTLPEKVTTTCDKCGHIVEKVLEIEPAILMALEKFVKVE